MTLNKVARITLHFNTINMQDLPQILQEMFTIPRAYLIEEKEVLSFQSQGGDLGNEFREKSVK